MLVYYTKQVRKYEAAEFVLNGPVEGNPFLEQWVKGKFCGGGEERLAEGFYDGEGVYKLRFMPLGTGTYSCEIFSSFGVSEKVTISVTEAEDGNHGAVRVTNGFHFAYEDGTAFYPVGTTCYAWALQKQELKEITFQTLAEGPFNKIRFCVFPKHYVYNFKEPELYPFEIKKDAPWKPEDYAEKVIKEKTGNTYDGVARVYMEEPESVWDFSRLNPKYFENLEECIKRLGKLGIEADIILFHPYDRWGFAHMEEKWENHYLKYVVNRFSAYHNVWWAMANEFDLMDWKSVQQWESNARVICEQDPYRHLRSIHNGRYMYDHTRGWITHCSIQRINRFYTAENTDNWRETYGKPCVLDEIAYEGNLPFDWGNISGQELTRRFWEAYARGGYGQHGETYESEDEIIWWSHGGRLKGESTARIAFLRRIMEENGGYMEPIREASDASGVSCVNLETNRRCILYYMGWNRPNKRFFNYPGRSFEVDVIDTWEMTVTSLGVKTGNFVVDLPSKSYMAVRLREV